MGEIKKIKLNGILLDNYKTNSKLSILIPLILFISFMFANFYYAVQAVEIGVKHNVGQLFLSMAIFSVFDYLMLVLLLWVYRSILSIRPYFYLVGKTLFNEKFKLCYIVKNMVLGAIMFLCFKMPYLEVFLPVISIILSYLVVIFTYKTLEPKIDIMFRHMFFKLLLFPWFIYQIGELLLNLLLGGY